MLSKALVLAVVSFLLVILIYSSVALFAVFANEKSKVCVFFCKLLRLAPQFGNDTGLTSTEANSPATGNNTGTPPLGGIIKLPPASTTTALPPSGNSTGTLPPVTIIKVPPGTTNAGPPGNSTSSGPTGKIGIVSPVTKATNALPTGNNTVTILKQPSMRPTSTLRFANGKILPSGNNMANKPSVGEIVITKNKDVSSPQLLPRNSTGNGNTSMSKKVGGLLKHSVTGVHFNEGKIIARGLTGNNNSGIPGSTTVLSPLGNAPNAPLPVTPGTVNPAGNVTNPTNNTGSIPPPTSTSGCGPGTDNSTCSSTATPNTQSTPSPSTTPTPGSSPGSSMSNGNSTGH